MFLCVSGEGELCKLAYCLGSHDHEPVTYNVAVWRQGVHEARMSSKWDATGEVRIDTELPEQHKYHEEFHEKSHRLTKICHRHKKCIIMFLTIICLNLLRPCQDPCEDLVECLYLCHAYL